MGDGAGHGRGGTGLRRRCAKGNSDGQAQYISDKMGSFAVS